MGMGSSGVAGSFRHWQEPMYPKLLSPNSSNIGGIGRLWAASIEALEPIQAPPDHTNLYPTHSTPGTGSRIHCPTRLRPRPES